MALGLDLGPDPRDTALRIYQEGRSGRAPVGLAVVLLLHPGAVRLGDLVALVGAKFGLPFTLLADEDHAVAEAYGSWVEKQNYGKTYWGTARTTFLVDPDGRIAHAWPKVKPEGHAADVLATLDEAQAARSAAVAR